MKRTDIGVKSGIIWAFTESLGHLYFADDIYLMAHSHIDIQRKTDKLVRNVAKDGLHVNKDKTKTMRNNCQTADPVKLGEQDIEEVIEFTYLGTNVTKYGGKGSFYIAQYPVRWTAQSASHFLPSLTDLFIPTPFSASPGSILARQQLRAKTKSLTFPPLSIARYSFIQLSEQGRL